MKLWRSKAIRAKCIDCCCGNSAEVRRCTVKKCPLWVFRMGNPSRCGVTLEEAEKIFSTCAQSKNEEKTTPETDEENEGGGRMKHESL